MSPRALVTGATSGIGLEISKTLLELGYHVVGVGRDFEKCSELGGSFTPYSLDLSLFDDSDLKKIDIDSLNVLVNCAGVGDFGNFEKQSQDSIRDVININLLAPILLANFFMNKLIASNGYLINISSVEATRNSKLSATYTASKSGLRAFSLSLFEEIRQKGVKVVSINPDITKTNFFDNQFFRESSKKSAYIEPNQIADVVKFILNQGENLATTDITIRPQISKITLKDRS